MDSGQRFFRSRLVFLALALLLFSENQGLSVAGKQVIIADGKIAFKLPLGWYETDLNADDVSAGYATEDNTSSIFFRPIDAGNGTMQDLMDSTIANFDADERFLLKKVDDYKTGQVNGIKAGQEKKWPAIFSQAEGIVAKEEERHEMRFYLLVFDTGTRVYFIQASTTLPARVGRENEIMEMIRSIVAKP